MAQQNIFDNSIIAFKTLNLNTEFNILEKDEIEVFEALIYKFANKHKRFTILTLKMALEKMGVDSDLLCLVKDKELEHLVFNGKYLDSIKRPDIDRKQGLISIIAKAICNEIISIDVKTIKKNLK